MGIYRLPNRVVTEAQTSCPLRAKGTINFSLGQSPQAFCCSMQQR